MTSIDVISAHQLTLVSEVEGLAGYLLVPKVVGLLLGEWKGDKEGETRCDITWDSSELHDHDSTIEKEGKMPFDIYW